MVGAYFVIELPDLEDQPARFAVLALIPLVLAMLHPRVFEPLADCALRKLGREPLPRTLSFRQVLGYCAGVPGRWALVGLGLVRVRRGAAPDRPRGRALHRRRLPGGVLRGGDHVRRAERARHARRRARHRHGRRAAPARWPPRSRWPSASSRRRSSWPTWASSSPSTSGAPSGASAPLAVRARRPRRAGPASARRCRLRRRLDLGRLPAAAPRRGAGRTRRRPGSVPPVVVVGRSPRRVPAS